MSDLAESDASKPRLCHLKIISNFSGYGFSLRTEAVGNVQHIEKVEKGSPAELGGLLTGDLLWKVNGKSVRGISHRQTVEYIKERRDEVQLLVLQPQTSAEYDELDNPIEEAEKNAVKHETKIDENSLYIRNQNDLQLSRADKQLLRADATTMSWIFYKRRKQLESGDPSGLKSAGCVNYGMTDEHGNAQT
ncbi:Ezrin-radixin-moesin-binding phosphoprotein 50 [Fasciola gigantica]|uniref:Ezrin-radixin-moesin-binding phosphoprotein 50 n=1 Tax=Fasciola gigantica TaxID=46835 RepID=A0A504YAP6_FASGI|nr:Ezrin-radixin-moesin-binding phosphoprotein 50 [Fasciola gigantica]